jgi:mitogen-activated protein kinase 1/3
LTSNQAHRSHDQLSRILDVLGTPTIDEFHAITVEQCLAHPYLDAYHDPEDEPSAKPLPSDFFDFDLQKDAISRSELKKLLYEEIMTFNPV